MSCTSVVISALAKTFEHIFVALWLCVSWPPMESKKATQHAHASFMEVKMFKQLRPQNFPNALVLQPQMESNKATRLFGAYLNPVVVSDQGHPES